MKVLARTKVLIAAYGLLVCLQLSQALVAAFGQDSEGGQWTVAYLMNKVLSNLQTWSSELLLINDTLQLLVALVEKRDRSVFVDMCQVGAC